jgi:hypothetical protein
MAAGTLPSPGTEYGPCADSCQHRDCALTRSEAATGCKLCGEAIGYETRYYNDNEYGLVHARCLENKLGL